MLWHTSEDQMISGLVLAIQFLTRLPVKRHVDFNGENLSKSILFYPFVGLLIGELGALVYYIFGYIDDKIASFFALLFMIILTGGLHLDGLADTFDGFLSYRERDRVLEIMKDSRLGSFGVLALIGTVLLKYILISSLAGNMFLILGLTCGNSRLIAAYLMSTKKVAKKEGIGYMFNKGRPKKYALMGGLVYLAIVLFIKYLYLIPLFFSFLVGEIMAKVAYKKIGGFTGDVYGASIELSELMSLLIFLEVLKWI